MTLEVGSGVAGVSKTEPDRLSGDVERELNRLLKSRQKGSEITQGELVEAIRHVELDATMIQMIIERLTSGGFLYVDDSDREIGSEEIVSLSTRRTNQRRAGHPSGMHGTQTNDDTVQTYLNEIGNVQLLTGEMEVTLANLFRDGETSRGRLALHDAAILGNGPEGDLVSPRYVRQLRQSVRQGDKARGQMIEANLRLVVSIAKRYRNRGVAFLDLIQEGNLGLMRAVDKFDPSKGFKFSTYATWWIRQAITRAVADQARTIRIPVHMVETMNRVIATQRRLSQELGREVSIEELAEHVGLSAEKVEEFIRLNQDTISLEQPMGEQGDFVLSDLIEDHRVLSPDQVASEHMLDDAVREVLRNLDERERHVVMMRFGLDDGKPATLEEVGKAFGITRERVRQIETKTIAKLRQPEQSTPLRGFLDSQS
jgi:RNA polymerase primary sigma factor